MNRERMILVIGLLIILAVIVTFIVLAISSEMYVFGLGEEITVDALVIVIGIGLGYVLLFSLPTLMVVSYQASSRETLQRKIQQDLFLCGLRDNDVGQRLQEFESRNSISAFVWPTLVNLLFLFVLWGAVFGPNGLKGVQDAWMQGDQFTVDNLSFRAFDGIAFFTYLAENASVITWSFLGAYFYVLTVLADRWLRSDLTTGVLWKLNIRVAVALVVGLLLTAVFPAIPKYGAFLVGIIPDEVLKFIGDRARSAVKLESAEGLWQASELQRKIEGINFWQSERLSEEGLESVQNLATKEIPGLLINVRFDTPQLLHWIDQALLRFQAGDEKMERFKEAYVRTATDLFDAAGQEGGLEEVAASMNEVSGDEGTSPIDSEELRLLMAALESGPNLQYLREYWSNVRNPEARSQKLSEASSFSYAAFKKG